MKTLGLRISLSLIGLLAVAVPRIASAAHVAIHSPTAAPAAQAAPGGQAADPSIVG